MTDNAPYGFKADGTPAKRRGRPPGSRNTVKMDDSPLTEDDFDPILSDEFLTAQNQPEDVPPSSGRRKKTGKLRNVTSKTTPPPAYSQGKVVVPLTRLYRTIGTLIKSFDELIGTAIHDQAEDAARAWDELARVNPRVRQFLYKLILPGGAWSAVIMAHLPILLAVIMRESIMGKIPFMSLFSDMTHKPEEFQEPSDLNPDDIAAMMNLFNNNPPANG